MEAIFWSQMCEEYMFISQRHVLDSVCYSLIHLELQAESDPFTQNNMAALSMPWCDNPASESILRLLHHLHNSMSLQAL